MREMKYFLPMLLIALLTPLVLLAQAPTPSTTSAPETYEALRVRVEQMNRRLQDWPQLSRYRDANAKVPAPSKDEPRVVFFRRLHHRQLATR